MATAYFSLQFMLGALTKLHDLESDTLKVALMTSSFTFDPATHSTWGTAGVSTNEIAAGNGYTAGGATLANVSVDINTTDDTVDISADDVTWTAASGAIATAASALIYNTTVSNTVVCQIDFETTIDTPDGKVLQLNLSDGFTYAANAETASGGGE